MHKEKWEHIGHVGGVGVLHAIKENLREVIYNDAYVGSVKETVNTFL